MFTRCEGTSLYGDLADDFTPVDVPDSFKPYPQSRHDGSKLTVEELIDPYGSDI